MMSDFKICKLGVGVSTLTFCHVDPYAQKIILSPLLRLCLPYFIIINSQQVMQLHCCLAGTMYVTLHVTFYNASLNNQKL